MRKFLLGVVVGVVVAFLGLFIVVLAIGRIFANRQPTIAGNSALVMNLQGNIPEAAPVEIPVPFLESRTMPTVRDIWASLREAATDSRIKAVVLEPHGLTVGWGKLEELRSELINFKKSGKPLYALLEDAGSREYYLASAADKIYLSPDDMLNVKGFRVESVYLKGTLDKLGVSVQVDHIGRYKDAGDMFTRTNMSPETRQVLGEVLDQFYNDFSSAVASGRHKTSDDIKVLIDQGPFEARQAKAMGLADELGYEDQVYGDLKKKTGVNDLKRVNINRYARAVPGKGDRIAVVVGEGDIVRGSRENSFGNEELITSGVMEKIIRQVRDDRSIKGVIVRVDSPGGDAVASDEILRELKLLSSTKPVVISMSDLAASGGYFISMTGDPLISYPNTITGSIGVLYVRPVVHDLFNKLGIQEDILTRGKLADIDSFYDPLSDAARQKLHEAIQTTYNSFVGKVAGARKKTFDQIEPLAQGRVWTGVEAKQNGLVDQLGGLSEAVALVRERAKLSPSGDTNLVMYPPKRSLFEILTSSSNDAVADAAVQRNIRDIFPNLPVRALLKGGMLRMLPYRFTVQ
ncbi:MAG: signal peptide peptidase SppA [Acidobacteriaceae bacterium]|nr:signal peptide peptidase SppA [Acidobacteriaceae bacterium]